MNFLARVGDGSWCTTLPRGVLSGMQSGPTRAQCKAPASHLSPSGVDSPNTHAEMVQFLVTEFHEPHIRELGSF